jgi:uncharacterized membrane protein
MYDDDDEHRGVAIALSVFATVLSIISLLVYIAQNGLK